MSLNYRGAIAVIALGIIAAGCGGSGSNPATNGFSLPVTETPGFGDPLPNDADFVDNTRAIGFYTDGELEAATTIPDSGEGFLKIFRLRNRGYATGTLVRTISLAASAWRAEYPTGDRVQIGDTADSNGGYLSGHSSHQNGLDADIGYLQSDHVERDPNTDGAGGFTEVFVKNGAVTANFDVKRNWAILRNLVGRGNVGRIFVDPVIKKTFCQQAAAVDPNLSEANRNEVLRRLRPYDNHDDHFHLRIKCPTGHTKCVAQTEPPSGNGCSDVTGSVTSQADARTLQQIADDDLGEDGG